MNGHCCACPCCGELTIKVCGNWEICANCGWEDDPVQSANEHYVGGANKISLIRARERFKKSGQKYCLRTAEP
jgi:hypothetical protein